MRYLEHCIGPPTLACDFKLLLCGSLLTDKLFLVASSILLPNRTQGRAKKHEGEYCVPTYINDIAWKKLTVYLHYTRMFPYTSGCSIFLVRVAFCMTPSLDQRVYMYVLQLSTFHIITYVRTFLCAMQLLFF